MQIKIIIIISACNDTDSWGENCANKCDCGIGTDYCDRLTGCVCNQGYNGTYCTENINECLRSPSPCINNQKCVDTQGSYHCTCETGYHIENETCVGMLLFVYYHITCYYFCVVLNWIPELGY